MEQFKEFEKFEINLKWFSGYITEPEITYGENGIARTKFAIPLKENKQDDALFLNCIIWGDLAEKFAENHKKGDMILVGGILEEKEYKNKIYINLVVKCVF